MILRGAAAGEGRNVHCFSSSPWITWQILTFCGCPPVHSLANESPPSTEWTTEDRVTHVVRISMKICITNIFLILLSVFYGKWGVFRFLLVHWSISDMWLLCVNGWPIYMEWTLCGAAPMVDNWIITPINFNVTCVWHLNMDSSGGAAAALVGIIIWNRYP